MIFLIDQVETNIIAWTNLYVQELFECLKKKQSVSAVKPIKKTISFQQSFKNLTAMAYPSKIIKAFSKKEEKKRDGRLIFNAILIFISMILVLAVFNVVWLTSLDYNIQNVVSRLTEMKQEIANNPFHIRGLQFSHLWNENETKEGGNTDDLKEFVNSELFDAEFALASIDQLISHVENQMQQLQEELMKFDESIKKKHHPQII